MEFFIIACHESLLSLLFSDENIYIENSTLMKVRRKLKKSMQKPFLNCMQHLFS